jgi:MFS superfamily sulfate permease-like transporter
MGEVIDMNRAQRRRAAREVAKRLSRKGGPPMPPQQARPQLPELNPAEQAALDALREAQMEMKRAGQHLELAGIAEANLKDVQERGLLEQMGAEEEINLAEVLQDVNAVVARFRTQTALAALDVLEAAARLDELANSPIARPTTEEVAHVSDTKEPA